MGDFLFRGNCRRDDILYYRILGDEMVNDLISRKALYEQTAEWEAAALEHVEKLDPEEDREEWVRWSAILQERSAFRKDVETAPAAEQKTGKWIIQYFMKIGWYRVNCSECGEDVTSTIPMIGFFPNAKPLWDYCPWCGAKMENGDDND